MAQAWSRSTLVSHEATSARRVLRIVGGWRCALVADALGAAAPFEQRSSLESPCRRGRSSRGLVRLWRWRGMTARERGRGRR